jgi:hypothetical protein
VGGGGGEAFTALEWRLRVYSRQHNVSDTKRRKD